MSLIAFLYDASALGLGLLTGFLSLAQQSLGESPMLLRLAFGPAFFFPKISGHRGDFVVSWGFELCGGHGGLGFK